MKYEIKHTCGHTSIEQIYGKTSEHDRKVAWYESHPCWECAKAQEASDAKATSESQGLPALTGSEKQIAWAMSIRLDVLDALANCDVVKQIIDRPTDEVMADSKIAPPAKAALPRLVEVATKIRGETSAKWWIDNRVIAVHFDDLSWWAKQAGI